MADHRPADNEYYELERTALFSQGDIFRDVPLAYPTVLHEVDEADAPEGDDDDWPLPASDASCRARSSSATPC